MSFNRPHPNHHLQNRSSYIRLDHLVNPNPITPPTPNANQSPRQHPPYPYPSPAMLGPSYRPLPQRPPPLSYPHRPPPMSYPQRPPPMSYPQRPPPMPSPHPRSHHVPRTTPYPHPDVKPEIRLESNRQTPPAPRSLFPQHPPPYGPEERHTIIPIHSVNVLPQRPPPGLPGPGYGGLGLGPPPVITTGPQPNPPPPLGQFIRFEYQVDPSRVRRKKVKTYKPTPDLLSLSSTEAKSNVPSTPGPGRFEIHANHPLYRSPGSVPPASSSGGVAASVPTYTHSYLAAVPRPAAPANGSPPQTQAQAQAPAQTSTLQPARATARRMSSSTSQSRGKSGFLGAVPPAPAANG